MAMLCKGTKHNKQNSWEVKLCFETLQRDTYHRNPLAWWGRWLCDQSFHPRLVCPGDGQGCHNETSPAKMKGNFGSDTLSCLQDWFFFMYHITYYDRKCLISKMVFIQLYNRKIKHERYLIFQIHNWDLFKLYHSVKLCVLTQWYNGL